MSQVRMGRGGKESKVGGREVLMIADMEMVV